MKRHLWTIIMVLTALLIGLTIPVVLQAHANAQPVTTVVHLNIGETLEVDVAASHVEWTPHDVATGTAVPALYTVPGHEPTTADLYRLADGTLLAILKW